MTSLNNNGASGDAPKPILKLATSGKKPTSSSLADISGRRALSLSAVGGEPEPDDLSIVELYQAARDENELLEFKNYELQFKIQELEQNQKRILSAICSNVTSSSAAAEEAEAPASTTTTKANGEADGEAGADAAESHFAPPTRNSSLEPSAPAASGGQLLQEQSHRKLVNANPRGESDSCLAKQQCANQPPGQVTSRPTGCAGDRATQADEQADVSSASKVQVAGDVDGHQFGKGLLAVGVHDASHKQQQQQHQKRHANESGALLSAAGGGASPLGTPPPPMAVERCPAKVDQLEPALGGQLQQLRSVGHENINNEPSAPSQPHDKYAPVPASGAVASGQLEDVARKTNRRSREPQPVGDRKWLAATGESQLSRGAHLIEYNGDCAPTQRDQAVSCSTAPRRPPDAHAACDSGTDCLPAASGQSSLASAGGSATVQSDDSQQEAMSNLSAAAVSPAEAPRRAAGARIAMPVQRRPAAAAAAVAPTQARVSSQKNAKQVATSAPNQSVCGKRAGADTRKAAARVAGSSQTGARTQRGLLDPLRSRSKSSLEQKGIARAAPQWQRPASLRRATSSSGQRIGLQASSADEAPTVRLSRALSSGQLSSVGRANTKQQQSATGLFVTHIPTLIGPLHAPGMAPQSQQAGPSSSKSNSPMMRRILRTRQRPVGASGQQLLANSSAKSKSLGNLAPASELADDDARSADHVTGSSASERPASMQLEGGRVRELEARALVGESSRSMSELRTEAEGDEKGEANCLSEAPIGQVHLECLECASQRNKVDKLIAEREQLREQISELEELENDSRLMSQNLAQQLLAMEKRLDKGKLELQRLTESESKLRFQNKRLHFELRQRQDCVGQLEHQMNELRSRARTLLRLQQRPSSDSAPTRKQQQLVAASQPEGDPDAHSHQKDSLAAKCKSATGSGSSAEDSDSDAIDELLEKRLSLQSDAGSSLEGSHGPHSDQKPLASVAYDSAYSKSSSSSSASDDANSSSTNSEADSSERDCAHKSSAGEQLAKQLAEWPKRPAEASSSAVAGSESVQPPSEMDKQQALLSRPSDQVAHKCATLCEPADCLPKTTSETDAITNCAGHRVETQSAPLNRIPTPTSQVPEQADKQQQQQEREPAPTNQKTANHQRSSIELALEGVDELEKARDRELEQFLAGRREPLPIKLSIVRASGDGQVAIQESEKATQIGIGVAAAATAPAASATPPLDNEQQVEMASNGSQAGQLGRLIDGLKHEVSSLKMRLVQANTLNDNLIRELKAQQHSSSAAGCKGQLELEGRKGASSFESAQPTSCLVHLNNLAPSNGVAGDASARWNHQQAPANISQVAGQQQPNSHDQSDQRAARRRSSVIYVNGLSASVTHHHHHYDRLQQQPQQTKAGQPESDQSLQQSQQQQALPACINCCFHRLHQTSDRYSPAIMQQRQMQQMQQQQQEFVDWLRFLLDKLHFHHGRTFELVSGCQKFAMNGLLASYNRQVSFLHHQRVVTAGNEAIRRATAVAGASDQHVATGRLVIENCKPKQATMDEASLVQRTIRPAAPPRQRAGSANRSLNRQTRADEMEAQLAPPPPLAPLDTTASVTALQVAKQTLASLVPIYYSCNKQQQPLQQLQPPLQANNGQPKLSLELEHGRAPESASASGPQNISAAKPADIYATVNKATKRSPSMGGVSVLEIGDQIKRERALVNSAVHAVNVVPTEPAHSQKLQISFGASCQHLGAMTTAPAVAPAAGVFQSINQQQRQLAGVRSSLSEDMERFRVHSNGQLLDLLMRQNWCESVISEKIKSLEVSNNARQSPIHQQHVIATLPDCGLPNVVNNKH